MPEPAVRQPSRRRWFRYSLRALFVAVTLAGVVLGLVVERAERQRRAVERIESLGGTVWYDFQYREDATGMSITMNAKPPARWSWARRLLGNHYFDTVWHVQAVELCAPQTANVQNWLGLKPVQTKFSRAPTQAIGQVAQLDHLKSLDLSYSRTADGDLFYLRKMTSLETLRLDRTQVTDSGLPHLSGMKQLRSLSLNGAKVTAAGVAELKLSLPHCAMDWRAP